VSVARQPPLAIISSFQTILGIGLKNSPKRLGCDGHLHLTIAAMGSDLKDDPTLTRPFGAKLLALLAAGSGRLRRLACQLLLFLGVPLLHLGCLLLVLALHLLHLLVAGVLLRHPLMVLLLLLG
jgi:hypothetical protein